jgi:GTPase SAR1 family protein
MNLFNTPRLKLAYEFVQYTNENIFLTGKAGTGKTTFLHNLKKTSTKRTIVVAPTGVAAINAGGVTMHSFFQMPFSPYIPKDYIEGSQTLNIDSQQVIDGHWKLSKQKINIIRSLDLLVIDEISMVRADILDQVDAVLRRYKNRNKVFGGVQLLMIGDVQQLAPIIKDDEWAILRNYYESIFFFSSKALKKVGFKGIELDHIFRQQDETFY